MDRPYPDAPWKMHGTAMLRAYRVPVDTLTLPEGFTPVAARGWTTGVLAHLEYAPPSPITYRELIWMPALVRAPSGARGFYVAKMYVDSEASLRGGRELWGLPKTLASFASTATGVEARAEDGTVVALKFEHLHVPVPVPDSIVTLQRTEAGVVRFRGDLVTARARLGRMEVLAFQSGDPGWRSFEARRALPVPDVALGPFTAVMQPPEKA